MTQQHALVEALIANGIELVTGSPGSEWVAVLDALAAARAENPKAPRYINCRHESLAVALASGYARVTGKVPVVLLHSAVGPLHAAMAIRAAFQGKAPLLLLCGDAVTGDVEGTDGGGGWIWLSRLADNQSSASFVSDYVKWNTLATSVPALVDAVSRGCAIARELPQGPAFAGVPCSLLLGEMPATTAAPAPYAVPQAPAPDLSEIAGALAGARQPMIVTEYAGRTEAGVNALVEIAESLGAAVYDGVDALYVNFPWQHPQYLGGRPDAALAAADVILCAGVTTPWFPPGVHVPPETRVIMLDDDINKTRLPYWNYRVQTRVPGNIERNLTALAAALKVTLGAADPQFEARAARREALAAAHCELAGGWQKEAAAAENDPKLTTVDFMRRLRELLPPETLIVDEAITHSGLARRILGRPGHYVKVGSGGLGVGIGYAIGAKLAQPERPVVFIVGDGTFTYNPVLAGLGACREYDLPLLTVVLDNGGYAAIRGAYRRYRPEGWAVSHEEYPGADFTPQPDYAALAAGFDAAGHRVSLPAETTPAVTAALAQLAAGRSSIIDVKLAP